VKRKLIVPMSFELDRTNFWGILERRKNQMTLMEDFRWAFHKVIYDWRERRPKQIRNALPPSYTTSTLRYIRTHACRSAAPDTIECKKWSQIDPWANNADSSIYPDDMGKRKSAFLRTTDFVCDQCKHPVVTYDILIYRLGLNEADPKFHPRTFQRYINGGDQMPTEQFQRAVVNALANDWLGLWQALSVMMQINQLIATQAGLQAVAKRALERKAFIERQEFDISEEEVERELVKQMQLIDNKMTRLIDLRLKNKSLDTEFRKLIEETRFLTKQPEVE
jgi:hypothetical protein